MKAIEFNILHYTDETKKLSDLDLPYPLTECDVRPMSFYNINAIGIHYDRNDNDREYCEIHTNGYEFIVADKSYAEVKKILDNL